MFPHKAIFYGQCGNEKRLDKLLYVHPWWFRPSRKYDPTDWEKYPCSGVEVHRYRGYMRDPGVRYDDEGRKKLTIDIWDLDLFVDDNEESKSVPPILYRNCKDFVGIFSKFQPETWKLFKKWNDRFSKVVKEYTCHVLVCFEEDECTDKSLRVKDDEVSGYFVSKMVNQTDKENQYYHVYNMPGDYERFSDNFLVHFYARDNPDKIELLKEDPRFKSDSD